MFLLPLFLLYTQVFVVADWKLFDTHIGLILLYCVFNLPFAIWTLRNIIDGIPKELDEAALVDGASTWQILTKIIFPLARPGLAVTGILTWIFAWNEYLFAATLTSVERAR
ncbi:Trehalose transport system permease protein SugB [Methylobrevis pamukkalensis]|uniref:Maltose/maltodextrin transport system permease protein MalG n=1 Tax=Methylobrevis pamukkalensis TaxID=1439726 RepID=A0A1E3GNN4_9HYPH|nr:Trehalose transport system permease protein SugB [Methylobrevis pamukkalensis]